MPPSARAGEVACPDPSAHDQHNKLSEQASSAALYVTDPARGTNSKENVLGSDGKLSSRSAAASLKYARPQDLPSFPSSGLGTANSAGKAALLAKDYKMKDLWQPEESNAGSKAAMLAHKNGGKLDLWQPSASKDGNSAAVLAMRAKGLSPELDRGYTPDGKHKALMAANLSIHKRAGSQPTTSSPAAYPDSHNSAFNALNAATVSHKASVKGAPDGWDDEANQAARVKNMKIDPAMFTEHPPVQIEQDEKKHEAALRASAVSMAKQMYEYQNRTMMEPDMSSGKAGANAANALKTPSEQTDVKQEALRYIHLQDAAHKLAQERLAKIDKGFENAKYREHYGYPDAQTPGHRKSLSKLSVRGRNRKRAGSEATAEMSDSDDEEQARRIRTQMNQLSTGLNTVDEKKRSDDRAKLLAAAEKKVHAQMHNMDERVFADTGRVPPAMLEEWEAKARKRAQEDRELASRPENKGKTHIGGGKFIDQSEIEAIAAARLKPTLDEINDTAEKRRAHDEEIRVARDRENTRQMNEKEQSRKQKEEWKLLKDQDKAAARKEKEEARQRKQEEKFRAQEEKRKSREARRPTSAELGGATAGEEAIEDHEEPVPTEEKQRGSRMSRIASKLRRKSKPAEVREAEDRVAEKQEHEGTTPVAALGTAGAAAGGVAAGEAAQREPDHEEERDDVSSLSSSDNEEQPPVVESTTNRTEGIVAPTPVHAATGRPDLERHITTVETSSEDSDDGFASDDDSDLEDEDRARGHAELAEKGRNHVAALSEGPSTIAAVDSAPADDLAAGNLGESNAELIAKRVFSAPVDQPSVLPTNGRTDETLAQKYEHHPIPEAAVDTPDAANLGASKTETGFPSRGESVEQNVAPAAAPAPNVKTGPDEPLQAHETPAEKEQKGGLRGFFSKFRNKPSKPESEVTKPKTSTEPMPPTESSITGKPSSDLPSSHMGTDGVIDNDPKVSGFPDASPTSSSSFKRHEGDLRHPDDASSSGAEEEDLARGRGGLTSTLKDWEAAAGHSKARATEDDDDEQFEEARDHFDERLAPPPAFAGQQKSESPSRATKFKEEV